MPLNKGLAICYIRGLVNFFQIGPEISTVLFPFAMLSQYIFGPLLFLLSLFIILIILLQRGRGGGLTGALGGAGGASAFGVKAGDIFTRITAVSVLIWICLCALVCFWYLPPKLDIVKDQGAGASSSNMGAANPDDLKKLDPSLFADPTPPANSNSSATSDKVAPPTPATSNAEDRKFELPPAANSVPASNNGSESPASANSETKTEKTETPAPSDPKP